MEPNQPNPQPSIQDPSVKKAQLIKKIVFSVAVVAAALAVGGSTYYYLTQINPSLLSTTQQTPPPTQQPAVTSSKETDLGISFVSKTTNDPIAKVGSETLYKKDLDYQITTYPGAPGQNQEIIAFERLVEESIILQGGQKNNLVNLDPSVFNSLSKDYAKRSSLRNQVKLSIEKGSNTLTAGVVSVWFLNNKVGPLGYEQSRKIANEKINQVYNQVKNGSLTIKQAGERIAADSSLSQIDPSYKSNAYFAFTATKDENPTFSKELNDEVWQLPAKSVTPIFTVQSEDWDKNRQMVDAYFSFAQVIEKKPNGKFISFESWLKDQKQTYEVQVL